MFYSSNLMAQAAEHERQANAEAARLAATFPVLADPDIDLFAVSHASGAQLQELAQGTLTERLARIEKARTYLRTDPETVWQADAAIARAKTALGVARGSVFEGVINDRLHRIGVRQTLRDLFLAALAIGLGLLSGGTGTVAVVAAVGAAAVSVTTAALHVQQFRREAAFAGSAVDRAKSLSASDPSLFWLAIDIAGAVADVGAAVKAFRALSASARMAGGLAKGGEQTIRAGEEALRREGNALRLGLGGQGLGDRAVSAARRARSDAGVLESTKGLAHPSPSQAGRELEAAQRIGQRRLLTGEYVEEIVVPSGPTWRRTADGHWCRFSLETC
jgi:hypothetical protein